MPELFKPSYRQAEATPEYLEYLKGEVIFQQEYLLNEYIIELRSTLPTVEFYDVRIYTITDNLSFFESHAFDLEDAQAELERVAKALDKPCPVKPMTEQIEEIRELADQEGLYARY